MPACAPRAQAGVSWEGSVTGCGGPGSCSLLGSQQVGAKPHQGWAPPAGGARGWPCGGRGDQPAQGGAREQQDPGPWRPGSDHTLALGGPRKIAFLGG